MKSINIIQHTSADYLGLLEDHLEGRKIGFSYCRPFAEGATLPRLGDVKDGIIFLGGGPWGTAGTRDIPSLTKEIELCRHCLLANKIIIGIGVGAQILAIAAGGTSIASPLEFTTGVGTRTEPNALNGYLDTQFPYVLYGRDWPVPPDYAQTLAIDEKGRTLAFQLGETAFGFVFHPGMKLAMAEDLIMEFDEVPANTAPQLLALQGMKREIEDNLVRFMTGLVQKTGLMR